MKQVLAAIALFVLAALLGFFYQDDPYVLARIGKEQDQLVLDHRDSPYAHITWVISEAGNYAQLKFFDRVEGGICLRPTWADISARADAPGITANDRAALAKNRMPADFDLAGAPPADTWPAGRAKPNPGTLANSQYVLLYPLAVLLNERLVAAAGDDLRTAAPDVLVVGLGSGVGISVLAHHFPEASVTVVDIDPAVVDMVYRHYPYFRWLRDQRTADGRPRLRLTSHESVDARVYIKHCARAANGNRPFDVVIIDAYTDGSTIPPHLMTREFYEDIGGILAEDGIILSNIIGSYSDKKRLVLGGAIRSMMAAGFGEVHNWPVQHDLSDPRFFGLGTSNNVVLAATGPLDPRRRAAAWDRLAAFAPYPALPTGTYLSYKLELLRNNRHASSLLGLADDEEGVRLRGELDRRLGGGKHSFRRIDIADAELGGRIREHLRAHHPTMLGWDRPGDLTCFRYDWVLHARETWALAVAESRSTTTGNRYRHAGTTLVPAPDAEGSADHNIPDAPIFTDARPNADIYNH